MLTPQRAKKMMGPQFARPRYTTLPVPYISKVAQKGAGCGCGQRGGDFLGIGAAFNRFTSNPLRVAAAIGTLGASEVIALPADVFTQTTGVKASKAFDVVAPVIGALAPEAAMGSKLTSFGLKQIGLGKKKKRRSKSRRKKK